MPPVPVPSPLIPSFQDAKGTSGTIKTALGWFSKIVDRFYGWSDGIIKHRQKTVDVGHQLQKAEQEAFRIMEEQRDGKRNAVEKALGRRDLLEDELTFEDLVELMWG